MTFFLWNGFKNFSSPVSTKTKLKSKTSELNLVPFKERESAKSLKDLTRRRRRGWVARDRSLDLFDFPAIFFMFWLFLGKIFRKLVFVCLGVWSAGFCDLLIWVYSKYRRSVQVIFLKLPLFELFFYEVSCGDQSVVQFHSFQKQFFFCYFNLWIRFFSLSLFFFFFLGRINVKAVIFF